MLVVPQFIFQTYHLAKNGSETDHPVSVVDVNITTVGFAGVDAAGASSDVGFSGAGAAAATSDVVDAAADTEHVSEGGFINILSQRGASNIPGLVGISPLSTYLYCMRDSSAGGICYCGNGCSIGAGCNSPLSRAALDGALGVLLRGIEVLDGETVRLQSSLFRLQARQEVLSTLLNSRDPTADIVMGNAVVDDWNSELCEELCGLESHLCALACGLEERRSVVRLIEDLLCSTEHNFIITPGGPFVVIDGVLTILFEYIDSNSDFYESDPDVSM